MFSLSIFVIVFLISLIIFPQINCTMGYCNISNLGGKFIFKGTLQDHLTIHLLFQQKTILLLITWTTISD